MCDSPSLYLVNIRNTTTVVVYNVLQEGTDFYERLKRH